MTQDMTDGHADIRTHRGKKKKKGHTWILSCSCIKKIKNGKGKRKREVLADQDSHKTPEQLNTLEPAEQRCQRAIHPL